MSVAHMDGAVGSEGAEGMGSQTASAAAINPAAYRMHPGDLPLAYKHDNGTAMVNIENAR